MHEVLWSRIRVDVLLHCSTFSLPIILSAQTILDSRKCSYWIVNDQLIDEGTVGTEHHGTNNCVSD